MPERTIAEFVNIADPIIEEYRSRLVEAFNRLKKSIEEDLQDMNENEARIFYTMLDNVQKEIEGLAEG